ncbi:MAG: flagellar motor switch protein FliM [Chthoniobacter sp.]|nr:flagellar motor switch protein FliM [Chthoniobacter sp.]
MSEAAEPAAVVEVADDITQAPVQLGPIFGHEGNRVDGLDPAKVVAYNFHNPGFLGQADMRQLGVLHQRFIQHLSARLSTFFRMECGLKLGKFGSASFSEFCLSLSNPTQLTLFQVEPLRGVGIVEITLPLGLTMSDRLLGGKGRVTNSERSLTEIEETLLEDAMQIIVTEWTQLLEGEQTVLRPQIIGHETSGRFLQTSSPDAVFVVTKVEVTLGELTEQLQIGIPFSMIEAMVKRMQVARQSGEDVLPKKVQWRAPYAGILVPITAEWKVREISLEDVLAMREGDVIQLPRELVSQTRVRLSNTEEFVGTVGMQNGHVAVQLGQRALKD